MIRYVFAVIEILSILFVSSTANISQEVSLIEDEKEMQNSSSFKNEETPSCDDQREQQYGSKKSSKVMIKRSLDNEPWLVFINSKTSSQELCAGALISPEWIVTTGSCLKRKSFKLYEVHSNKKDQNRLIDHLFVHHDFHLLKKDNDIALIKTEEPFSINKLTFPTCIQNPEETILCKNLCEIGHTSGAPDRVALLDKQTCKRYFENIGHGNRITGDVECLATLSKHVTSSSECTGLTGSPLTCQNLVGEKVLTGVLSLGWTCIHQRSPAIYTKISRYHKWITDVINSNDGSTKNVLCSRASKNKFYKEVKRYNRDFHLDVFIPRDKGNEERVPRYDHLRDVSEYMQMKDLYGKYFPLFGHYYNLPNNIKPHYLQGAVPGASSPDQQVPPPPIGPPQVSATLQVPNAAAGQSAGIAQSPVNNGKQGLAAEQAGGIPQIPRNLVPPPCVPCEPQPSAGQLSGVPQTLVNVGVPRENEPESESGQPVGSGQTGVVVPSSGQSVPSDQTVVLVPPSGVKPVPGMQTGGISQQGRPPAAPVPESGSGSGFSLTHNASVNQGNILGDDGENILALPLIKLRRPALPTLSPLALSTSDNRCSNLNDKACINRNETIMCGDQVCFPKTISHFLLRFRGDPAFQRPAHDIVLKANKKLNLNLVKSFKLMLRLTRV